MRKGGAEEEILSLLRTSGEKYLSGEALSKKFKVSRTAIWKHIHSLMDQGYEFESHTNLGYRLQSVPDLLLPAEIENALATKYVGRELYCFNEIGSTNDMAARLTEKEVPEGTVVTAEKQTAGKGRLGRTWASPERSGLWFSVILRPKISPYHSPKLTFIAGLSVLDAIKKVTGEDAELKWPNDVMLRGKKLCGILTEMKAEMDIVNYLIIGIGINVNLSKNDLPESVRGRATSLKMELRKDVPRVKLLAEALKSLEEYYELFKQEGPEPIIKKWKRKCATLGRKVKIQSGGELIEGIAEDIDGDCALLVRLADGTVKKAVTGDVS